MAIEGGSRFSKGRGGAVDASLDAARRSAVEARLRKAGASGERAAALASMIGAVVGGVGGGVAGFFAGGGAGAVPGAIGGAGLGAGLGAGIAKTAQGDPGRGVPLIIGGMTAGAGGYAGAQKAGKPEMDAQAFRDIIDTGFYAASGEARTEIYNNKLNYKQQQFVLANPELASMFGDATPGSAIGGY